MDEGEGGVKRKSRLAVFEHVAKMEKAPKKAQFEANKLEYEESSPSETELIIDEEKNTGPRKKKNPCIKYSEEPLSLQCRWNLCEDNFSSWQEFNSHLMEHAANNSEHIICQWINCSHVASTVTLFMQHLSYHGYISKITNIGQNVAERYSLPKCNQREALNIPVEKYGYTCEWENCSYNFCTIYDFLIHVATHAKKNPNVANEPENEIRCFWRGCETKYSTPTKLAEHLRTHSKEKVIGCPTCFTIFSSKTKFCDHRRRQQSNFIQSYQCSQCLKLFPSERLLRDHIRSHINHYKCTMCDMTCSKPSLLAKHIRFKHVKDKPYVCPECKKTFVAKHNLDTHLKIHEEKNPMRCGVCDYTCRTRVGLDNHYVRKHDVNGLSYECHCCKKIFKRGGYLTKHLTKLHNYHWPSGHSRFKYRKDQDGIYRLQTVRLESLEVTQEVIRSETMPTSKVKEGVRYLLNYDNGKTGYVLSISETNEQTLKPADKDEEEEEEGNNVLITIQDLDEDGNVLKSRIVQSEIVENLPLHDNAVVVGSVNDKDTFEKSSFNKSTDSETSLSKSYERDVKDEQDSEDDENSFECKPHILDYEMFKKESEA